LRSECASPVNITFTSPYSGRATVKNPIKQKIGDSWGNMFTALSAVDRRKNGVVSKNEFKSACETSNSKLTPVEVERVVKYID